MDYCSDLESFDWKSDPNGELAKQYYLAYLNLKKSDEPSDLESRSKREIVTVRRTRRVLYRYILDKSIDETNGNDEKGGVTKSDTTSNNIPRIVLRRKERMKKISLVPNHKTRSTSRYSKMKRSRKRLSGDFKKHLTNKSKNECKEIIQKRDHLSNNVVLDSTIEKEKKTLNICKKKSSEKEECSWSSDFVKNFFEERKEPMESPSEKQLKKMPPDDLISDGSRIPFEKRENNSYYPFKKRFKAVYYDDDPEKINKEQEKIKRELEVLTEEKLADFYFPPLNIKKDEESKDETKFVLIEKSLNSYDKKFVAVGNVSDNYERMTQDSRKLNNVNFAEKISAVEYNGRIKEKVEPSLVKNPTDVEFNNPSIEQSDDTPTLEKQFQEIFFPAEHMGGMDIFVPVPHIEIEVEIETSPEIIPPMKNVVNNNFSPSRNCEQIANDTGDITNCLESIVNEEQINNTLVVSKHFTECSDDKQQKPNDTLRVLKRSVEPSICEEQIGINTSNAEKNVALSKQETCLSKSHDDIQTEISNTLETETLDCLSSVCNNEIRCNKEISNKINEVKMTAQLPPETTIDLQQVTKDYLGITKHSLDLKGVLCPKNTFKITNYSPNSNIHEEYITNSTVGTIDHSVKSTNNEQQITKDTLGKIEHSQDHCNHKWYTNKQVLNIFSRSPQPYNEILRGSNYSLQPNNNEHLMRRDESGNSPNAGKQPYGWFMINRIRQKFKESMSSIKDKDQIEKNTLEFEKTLEPHKNEGQVETNSLPHLLSDINEGCLSKDEPKKPKFSLEPYKSKQQIKKENVLRSKHCLEENILDGKMMKLNKHRVETHNCALQEAIDSWRTKKHCIQSRIDEHQRKTDILGIPKCSLQNYKDEQQMIKDIAEPSPEIINKKCLIRKESQKISEHSLEMNVDEQPINRDTLNATEHSTQSNKDKQQIISDMSEMLEYYLPHIKKKQQTIMGHSLTLHNKECRIPNPSQKSEYSLDTHSEKQQIKKYNIEPLKSSNSQKKLTKDSLIITKHHLELDNVELQKIRGTLRISEHPLKFIKEDQQLTQSTLGIIKNSLEPNKVEQQRTRILECSLEHNKEERQIERDTMRIIEHSLESKNDECQIRKEFKNMSEQFQQVDSDEHQIMRDKFRLSEYSSEYRKEQQKTKQHSLGADKSLESPYNECSITKRPQKISEQYLEVHRDNQQIKTNFRLSENTQKKINEETKDFLRITDHSLKSHNDKCLMAKASQKIYEQYLEVDIAEQQIERDNITHNSEKFNKNGQEITGNMLRLLKHSLEHKKQEQKVTSHPDLQVDCTSVQKVNVDSLRTIDHSLKFKTDGCQLIKEFQNISKQCIVEINSAKQQIKKDSITQYSDEPNNDEHQEKTDKFRLTEHSLEHSKADRQMKVYSPKAINHSLEFNNDESRITKECEKISEQSLEMDSGKQQKEIYITQHFKEPNNDENQTRDTSTLIGRSLESRKKEHSIKRDSPGIMNYLQADSDEQYKTRESSQNATNNEQRIKRDILNITEYCVELNNDKQQIMVKDHPKISEYSSQPYIDEHGKTQNILKITECSIEPNNDEQQIMEDITKLSKESLQAENNEQHITNKLVKLTDHFIESNNDEPQVKKEFFKISNIYLVPNNVDQQITDTLILPEQSVENKNCEEQILVDTIEKGKDLRVIKKKNHCVEKQPITRDSPRREEEEIIKETSTVTKHSSEFSNEEDNYAELLNISLLEQNNGIENCLFPEHVKVKIEDNVDTQISMREQSLDNSSLKSNCNGEKIYKDNSIVTKHFVPEKNVAVEKNFSPKSISMMKNLQSTNPRFVRISKSLEEQLSPYTAAIQRRKEQKNYVFGKFCAQNVSSNIQKQSSSPNDSTAASKMHSQNEEVESGEPFQLEVIHYKPTNSFQRKYCTFCNVGYTNQILYEKHIYRCKLNPRNIKMDPVQIFYCKFCNFGITDKVFFRQHEEKCQSEFISKSSDSSSNSVMQEAGSKFKKKRSSIGRNKCPNCHYTSDNVGHMSIHRRIHDKVPLCACDVCQKGFTRVDALKLHMFKHIDVATEVLEKDEVDVWNGNACRSTLEVNIKDKKFTMMKYQCSSCKYATPVADSMEKHINSIHLNISSFKCNLCSFATKLKTNLRQHLNWHSKEKTYRCSFCSYETISKSYVKQHENQVHLKAISFDCEFCDFKAYRKENLKAHVNSMHLKQKKYLCKQCDYYSYVQSNLIAHVKCIHEGVKRKYKQK